MPKSLLAKPLSEHCTYLAGLKEVQYKFEEYMKC